MFDAPLVVAGKRHRRQVERLSVASSAADDDAKDTSVIASVGNGTKLGDIPYIEYQIEHHKVDELKKLATFCCGRVKKHVSGFFSFTWCGAGAGL